MERTWERLFDTPGEVETVHFLELGGPPRIGFVGCGEAVYRTTDGGDTWARCTVTAPNFTAMDFTFKDSLTGWFSNYGSNLSKPLAMCYKTTDGGLTWNPIYGPTVYASSIMYRPENGLLLLASWFDKAVTGSGKSCYSTDEGLTWNVFQVDQRLNGFAFLNKDEGVATCANLIYLHTTDGGFTWSFVNSTGDESWQPVASSKSGLFFASSEITGKLFSSLDGGRTFRELPFLGATTGTLREGSCGTIYAQYQLKSAFKNKGVVRSQDGGTSWTSLGGPINGNDTRFYVKGGYVFAGGTDTLTHTNSVWRYVEDSTFYDGGSFDTPQVSDTILYLVSPDCGKLDSTLSITYLNDCSLAELISAELSPTSRFAVPLKDTLPVRISGVYPIPVLYSPVGHVGDTAYLTLTYHTHGVDKRTVVKIIGSVPGDHTIARFSLQASGQNTVSSLPGDVVPVDLMLLNDIGSSLGLDSIAFDMDYNENVATPNGLTINPPWSLLRESHTFGHEEIAFRRTDGADLAANSSVATFQFKTFLSSSPSTTITASNFRLNDGDSVYLGCTATATDPGSVNYFVRDTCSDPTLRHYLANEPIIDVAYDGVTIRWAATRTVSVSLFDVLGNPVSHESIAASPKPVAIKTSSLSPGVYFGRVESSGFGSRSFRFVKH